MTPNLRFNKSMTKLLIKSIPNDTLSLNSLNWRLDNTKEIYGSYCRGIFTKNIMFFLQRMEEDKFRLLVIGDKGSCNCYLIDDIEQYLKVIGITKIEPVDKEDEDQLYEAVNETKAIPNTGIIIIDEEENIFVYDHTNN